MNTPADNPFRSSPSLSPRRFTLSDIGGALVVGWHTFRAIPGPSVAFSMLFALIGLAMLMAVGTFGVSPMAWPVAGGFMLVAPALLTGFFRLATVHAAGNMPRMKDAFVAFAQAPAALWLIALLCAFLFLIWITDAAILYAMMVGGERLTYDFSWVFGRQRNLLTFALWGSLMGSVLAYIILAISAFSVPLLFERRASPVQAIHASVRAVVGNFFMGISWGLIIAGGILFSIALLPLLTVSLPVLAYASFALYRTVFPPGAPNDAE